MSSLSISELESYVAAAQDTDCTVSQQELLLFPYYDLQERQAYLASVLRASVASRKNPSSRHTVLISYQETNGQPEINLWCGDRFSEGRISEADARARCAEAAAGVKNAEHASALAQQMFLQGYDKYEESTACNFWRLWKGEKKVCKHLSAFMYYLRRNNPNFVKDLVSAYQEGAQPDPAGASKASEDFGLDSLAFKVPVLFEGDRGAGKTHTARAYARTHGYACVECPGHEGVEAPDLVGYLVPYGPQQMVWKDGPISEAFRRARKGKTVLIIDELLRIPTRELSLLLTAFTPDNGVYRLRTGRILSVEDGVANEEVLECPVDNLCVVATTNVGAEYAVDDIDPALAERFVVIRMDTTKEELQRILKERAEDKGLSAGVVTKALAFYVKMVEAANRGLIQRTPTTRTLTRAFDLASCDADVKRALRAQFLLWVARTSDGRPVAEQLKHAEEILNATFK